MATAVNVLQWGHFARRRDTPGAYLQGLGVDVRLGRDSHTGALVEPGRAGRILAVDAETDPACAPPVQLAEGVAQQRIAESPAPVFPTSSEDVDPAHPEQLALALCSGSDCAASADEETEFVLKHARVHPLLEGAILAAPVVLERVLEDLVEDVLLSGRERRDIEPLWPFRRVRLDLEIDHHAEEAPDGLQTTPPEKARGRLVLAKDPDPHFRRAERTRAC